MLDDQNRLVMQNAQLAREFAAAFGLLATEHWSHPVHRLQLQFFGELIKAAILNGSTFLGVQPMLHPLDALYTVDSDLLIATRQIGPLNNNLHAQMLDIARAQRRIFAWGRESGIAQFMQTVGTEGRAPDFPHPLDTESSWQMEYSGAVPQNIEMLPVAGMHEVVDFGQLPHCLDTYLPPLKSRAVDPLFYDEHGEVRRLSEADPHFKSLLAQHRALQSQAYVARLYMAPRAVQDLRRNLAEVQADWDEAVRRPRSPESAKSLRENIQFIGGMAVGHSPNAIRLG